MDGNFDNAAINTFKSNLPAEHGLKKSLTGKPTTSVRQLMDQINKYKRVEEDQMQGKGKEEVIPHEMRDFTGQSETTNVQNFRAVFREPMHQMLEKIKSEPYFRWPNKMAGESIKRNQHLYCQYHPDHGHTMEDCSNLWNYLD